MQLDFLAENLQPATDKRERSSVSENKSKKSVADEGDLFGGMLPCVDTPKKTGKKSAQTKESAISKAAEFENKAGDEVLQKSDAAFRTIGEAASLLGVPQHVLRFWESRFSQVKPLKMGGGRRYYRPEDIDILSKIHNLLHKQGYTIKAAKKIFGVKSGMAAKTGVTADFYNKARLTDKQRKQVAAIRQDLLALRARLHPYLFAESLVKM